MSRTYKDQRSEGRRRALIDRERVYYVETYAPGELRHRVSCASYDRAADVAVGWSASGHGAAIVDETGAVLAELPAVLR